MSAMRPLLRSSLRHYRRHPLQLGLALLGVALGVAVVTGVDIASTSARIALGLATEAVSGRATHHVVGGPLGLPDSVYRRLRVDAGIDSIAPIVEGVIRLEASDSPIASGRSGARTIRLLGVDPFAEAPFRSYLGAGQDSRVAPGAGLDMVVLLTRPGALLLPAPFAAAAALVPGDSFAVSAGGVARTAVLAGVLDPADALSRRALADLAVADIATAQELLGRVGWIDRIDVRAAERVNGADPSRGRAVAATGFERMAAPAGTAGERSRLDRLEAALPPSARLVTAAARADATAELSRAFEINLTALGLLALVFGAFLIYNSIRFAVVQRRPLLGLLRAQGVTRREVLGLVIVEAAAIGVIATAFGLALGAALGRGLIGLVARTINDLYFRVAVSAVAVEPVTIAKASLLGVGATILAGLAPAREAARVPPRAALSRAELEAGARRGGRTAAVAGTLLLVSSLALLRATNGLALGFVSLFGVIFAAALLTPIVTAALMAVATRPAGLAFGLNGRIATRGVTATLSRTAPAIAALAVAIAVGAAVGLMIAAFRVSVEDWLDTTLQADAYVSAPAASAVRGGTLDPDLVRRLIDTPGVAGATAYRHVALPQERRDLRLSAVALHPPHRAAFTFLEGPADEAWLAFDRGGVIISEPFANRSGAARGDTLRLPTDRGERGFVVGGVFRDYASEHGVVFIDRATYDTYWDDDGVSSLGVFAEAGLPADTLIELLRGRAGADQDVFVRSDRGLRDATLAVFDRTFAITAVLRLLALAVAFVGVLAALMALQLDRAHELGVLRAIGVTPAGVRGLVMLQTALIGLAAGVIALPLATVLAWLMIDVINRRAFGWTVPFAIDAWLLAQALLLALAAALLAGVYPAARMARTRTAVALREE